LPQRPLLLTVIADVELLIAVDKVVVGGEELVGGVVGVIEVGDVVELVAVEDSVGVDEGEEGEDDLYIRHLDVRIYLSKELVEQLTLHKFQIHPDNQYHNSQVLIHTICTVNNNFQRWTLDK
jgi:hypothetical protein